MKNFARLLAGLALLLTIPAPSLRGADQTKPRVRAITGFVTIDAKSYPAQLEEAAAFLTRVRDAVKAAGYDVSGIRISTQPFPEYTRGMNRSDALALLHRINELASTLRFNPNIGPAMVNDGDDTAPADLLVDVLSEPGNRLNANIVVAGEDGIHWNAVRQAARIIKNVGERSPHGQGNFNFGAIAMLKPYGPFYPGAWHPGDVGPRRFAIGLEAANVVMDVFSREHDPRTAGKALADALGIHARAVEAAATSAAAGSGWTYAGIDPTPAPGGQVSIGAAIESFTGAPFGSPGTETAAAVITQAVKQVQVKQTGYSGLMIPVLEDTVLTRRWTEGTYSLDSILAYSAVCAGGVDTVPLPGDTSEAAIAGIVGDVASLAFKWNKPLAARLLPAPGKRAGETTEFSGALANAVIHPLPGFQAPRDPLVREGTTRKVSPHVYVIPDDDVPLVPNVGIIVGTRATLVIDTGLGPKNGETVVREVTKVSKNPDLYLAVTHVHPEHDLGAQAFPASTRMIRSRGQDADIAEFGLQLAETFASESPVRAQLLKGATYRKTDMTFDNSYMLDLGGVRVQMQTVGPTHTRGDTVFFVEGDDTLFAGDVVMSALPAFASPYSSVRAWLAALDRLDAMHPQVIVPSHGRLVDASAIAKYREYLHAVQSRARELKQQGKSADEAAQIIQAELQKRFADMAQPSRIAGAAKAAYVELP